MTLIWKQQLNIESRTHRLALLDMSYFLFFGGGQRVVKQLNVAMEIGSKQILPPRLEVEEDIDYVTYKDICMYVCVCADVF